MSINIKLRQLTVVLCVLTSQLFAQSKRNKPANPQLPNHREKTYATAHVSQNIISHSQNNDDYRLVWADEFNTDGRPDSTNWRFEQGFLRNHELQWYQPQNAWCENGLLIIEVRKEQRENPRYNSGSSNWKVNRPTIEYTSSSLNTSGLRSWRFGRFVMRGKIDIGPGLWPAFWTLGNNGQWPSNGEIDIMEYYKGKVLANIATGTSTRFKPKWFTKTKEITAFNDPNWANKFHVWRMDWDENAISLFIDDELLNKVELKHLVNDDGTKINPFEQPHYILLNFALGGDNGGEPLGITFPKRFEVDYVRVYQK